MEPCDYGTCTTSGPFILVLGEADRVFHFCTWSHLALFAIAHAERIPGGLDSELKEWAGLVVRKMQPEG